MFGIAALTLFTAYAAQADVRLTDRSLVVTASNAAANQLLIYNAAGQLLKTIPTAGQGGVSGNAGGIAYRNHRLAVVNFLSGTVSVFRYDNEHTSFRLEEVAQSLGSPVSVAFGGDHLYVLTTTQVESYEIDHGGVHSTVDGVTALIKADGFCGTSWRSGSSIANQLKEQRDRDNQSNWARCNLWRRIISVGYSNQCECAFRSRHARQQCLRHHRARR